VINSHVPKAAIKRSLAKPETKEVAETLAFSRYAL
jgi:hypothetical protein